LAPSVIQTSPRASMSMSVGFRTIGSEAKSETSRPSATVNFFTDSRAASGPTPAGLAANNVEAASASGPRSNDFLFIVFGKANAVRCEKNCRPASPVLREQPGDGDFEPFQQL